LTETKAGRGHAGWSGSQEEVRTAFHPPLEGDANGKHKAK